VAFFGTFFSISLFSLTLDVPVTLTSVFGILTNLAIWMLSFACDPVTMQMPLFVTH